MKYIKIDDYTHLLIHPVNRKKFVSELIYSSGGSYFETPKDRGKKHLLEHCIVSRTKTMDFQKFQDYQFSQNITFNAYTSPLTMGIDAQGHMENAMNSLQNLLEMFFTPTFDQSILDTEKEIVLREISERSGSPSYRLYFYSLKKVFEKNSIDLHEVLGKREMVAQTTLDDFYKLHKQNLANSHFVISVGGGGFEEAEVVAMVQDSIQKLKSNSLSFEKNEKHPVDFYKESMFKDFKTKAITSELAHENVDLTVYIPWKNDFQESPKQKIFEELFLKYQGVIYDRLRNREGLIYSLQWNFSQSTGSLILNLACEIEHVHKIMEILDEIFNNLQKYFVASKFVEVRDILRKNMEIKSDSIAGDVSFARDSLLSYGRPESLEDFKERVTKITQEQMSETFNSLKENWKFKRVVMISKDVRIQKLKIS